MKKCVLFWIMLLSLAILSTSESLFAHDMWLQPQNEGFIIAVGHEGKIDVYEPDRVVEVTGFTKNAWPVAVDLVKNEGSCFAMPDEDFCSLIGTFDNQYWIKSTEGWKNQRETKGLEVLIEGRSYKHTKHISSWQEFLSKPLGQRFEIVPLQDPTKLKKGDTLRVKIFFEDKPANVSNLSKTSDMTKTHEQQKIHGVGPFDVIIGKPGLQLINTKIKVPVKDRQVIMLAASLTFYTTE